MRLRHADLLAVAVLALLGAAGILLLPGGAPRFLCAVVLLLVAPGYALAAASFRPETAPASILVMSCVLLGISQLAVGAVLLDASQVGLGKAAWTIYALLVTVGACAVAIHRRLGESPVVRLTKPRLRATEIALLVLAGVAVSAGVAISRTPLPAKAALGYTQLWMLPAKGGGANDVMVGVRNAEQQTYAYRLELLLNNERHVLRSRLILAPGAHYEQLVRLADRLPLSADFAETRTVTAQLYRLDQAGTYYRRVTARLRSR